MINKDRSPLHTCHRRALFPECRLQPGLLGFSRTRLSEEEDDAERRWKDDEVADKPNAKGLWRYADGAKTEPAAARLIRHLK